MEAEPGRVGPDGAEPAVGPDGYDAGSSLQNEAGFALTAGDWYYVASTFRVVSGKTLVNTYVANLSRGERTLSQVVRDQSVPGVPAASRLGVGKAFDADTAHAYPWPGRLDEIAIYDTVLSPTTLAVHLQALTGAAVRVIRRPSHPPGIGGSERHYSRVARPVRAWFRGPPTPLQGVPPRPRRKRRSAPSKPEA